MQIQPSLNRAVRSWTPMLSTGSTIDEMQIVILRWALSKRKDSITYYAPPQQVFFAWGYVAGLAATMQRNHIEVAHINPAQPDFSEGIALQHERGNLIILSIHTTSNAAPGNNNRKHTESPPLQE